MPIPRQLLIKFGEERVAKDCTCPKCKKPRTLVRLPSNIKCADVICDFCGYLAQVKTVSLPNADVIPKVVPGAAWGPQRERMDALIFVPLFLVLVEPTKRYAIYYLPTDLQVPNMFVSTASSATSKGFMFDFTEVTGSLIRIR